MGAIRMTKCAMLCNQVSDRSGQEEIEPRSKPWAFSTPSAPPSLVPNKKRGRPAKAFTLPTTAKADNLKRERAQLSYTRNGPRIQLA